MPNTHAALFNHCVFSTKLRTSNLRADIRPRLFAYMGGICRNINCVLLGAGGVEDHVHLLVRRHPTVCESDLMRDVKANSSSWMKEFVPGFGWQDGGGLFTVGPRDTESVLNYLAGQEEHHKREDFKTEYLALLDLARVEYDLKYVFD